MNSLREVKSRFKFLSKTLQDCGTMPIFKRTFSQDLDLLEQHLTTDILSQIDCNTTLTKLRTKFENAFNSEFKEQDLKGTRIKHGFKRAFMSLFGKKDDTFTSTMLLSIDQLQKQLDKDEFQEDKPMAAFWMIYESKINMGKAMDVDLVITESSGIESKVQDDSNRFGNDTDMDDFDIGPIYDEEPMAEVTDIHKRTKTKPKRTKPSTGLEEREKTKPRTYSSLMGNGNSFSFYSSKLIPSFDSIIETPPRWDTTRRLTNYKRGVRRVLPRNYDPKGEVIKSSFENLFPIPSESEDFSDIESECDMPDCDDSQTIKFSTISNPLFNDSTSSDDESSHEEVIHEISFKTYSNPLFDLDEEIISSEFNPIHNEDLDSTLKNDRFDTKYYLLESLLNRDTLMASSPNFDSLLKEFSGKLAHTNLIPPGINEANCYPEEDIHLVERLLYDNSSPRPPKDFKSKNSDVIIKSFSPSPIPVEDSDPFMEEIDLFLASDGSIPPGIDSDYSDSEVDNLFLERLLHDDPIPLSDILDFSNVV
uniref:SPK domain-containing protein n=1 Tax=Tanacetum cinerariifolium TaxID=118510 RepID=A0A6L2K242_TANCI|nr:hypothetical protein [Tanacetum cinerariifolium]